MMNFIIFLLFVFTIIVILLSLENNAFSNNELRMEEKTNYFSKKFSDNLENSEELKKVAQEYIEYAEKFKE